MRTTIVACMPLLLIAGCGAGAAPAMETTAASAAVEPDAPSAGEEQLVADYDTDVETLEADFLSNFELAADPDCGRAAELRDRICEPADRVCDIADRHPGWPDVQDKCEDGRGRCDRAADMVAQRCGE